LVSCQDRALVDGNKRIAFIVTAFFAPEWLAASDERLDEIQTMRILASGEITEGVVCRLDSREL
jgi:hypothetical protein